MVLFPFPYSLLTVYWLSKPALAPSDCLVWSENDPLEYSRHLPPLHTSGPNHVLLQIGPVLIDGAWLVTPYAVYVLCAFYTLYIVYLYALHIVYRIHASYTGGKGWFTEPVNCE